MLGRLRIGPGQADRPVGVLRVRCPHLLAGECPTVGGPFGARPQRGEVRARPRLAEQLAPLDLAAQGRAHESPPLLVGAVREDGGNGPFANDHGGLGQPQPGEFLGDDDLLHWARVQAVGARVARRHQPSVGQEYPWPAFCSAAASDSSAAISERTGRLTVERSVCLRSAAWARRPSSSSRSAGGPLERLERHRPPPVQVDVMLPGVADAAEQGDRLQGEVDRSGGADHGRGRCGQSELLRLVGVGHGGVPRGRHDELGPDEQPGALVLDRLELADRAAELLPHLDVVQPGPLAPPRQAGRLGRQQRRDDVPQGGRVGLQPAFGGHPQAVPAEPGRCPG